MMFGSRTLKSILGLALVFTVGGCSLQHQSCCCDRKDVGLVTVRGSITNTRVLPIPTEGLTLGHAVSGLATTETQQLVSYATQTASNQDFDKPSNALIVLLAAVEEQADASKSSQTRKTELPKLRAALAASIAHGIEPPLEVWGKHWFDLRNTNVVKEEFDEWLTTKASVGEPLVAEAKAAIEARNEISILESLEQIKSAFEKKNKFIKFSIPAGQESLGAWAKKLAARETIEESFLKSLSTEQQQVFSNLKTAEATKAFLDSRPVDKLPTERIYISSKALFGDDEITVDRRKKFIESIQTKLSQIQNPAKANLQNRSGNSGIIETNIVRLQRANGENLVMPLGMAKEGAASAIMLQDGDTVHCLTMAEMPEIDGGSTGFDVSQVESFGIANIAILNRIIEGSKFTYIVPLENLGASAARKLEYDYFRNNFKVAEGESAVLHTLELQPGVIKGLAMQRRLIRDAAMKAIEKEEGYAKQVVHKTADTGKAVAAADRELSDKIPVVRDIKAICRQSIETASNSVKSASSSLGF